MRDWKKRLIVAGILFVVCVIILIARILSYKEEAVQMSQGTVVSSEQEMKTALEKDGVIYAKGIISGSLNMDEITLNHEILSADPADILEGQAPFFPGKYMGFGAKVGNYEYIKERYESNRVLEHHFYSKEEFFIHADKVEVFGMDFDVRESKKLFENLGVLKQEVGSGSFTRDPKTGATVPTFEMPEEKYFRGFELYAYPSEVEGALKCVVENGEILPGETVIFPAAELELIEDLAETGTMDYATEIGAFVIFWIVLTLIAWFVMRLFGL
ncbi:MAG: hypothetical protein Q4A78_04095 [Peptostreptococcaceae bacterium]|nr:hypothetical protein [Peptostreptococcaceae bacterium]